MGKWIPKLIWDIDTGACGLCRPYGSLGLREVVGGDGKRRVVGYWDFCWLDEKSIGVTYLWYDGPIWVFSFYCFSVCNLFWVERTLDDAPEGSLAVWKTKEVGGVNTSFFRSIIDHWKNKG